MRRSIDAAQVRSVRGRPVLKGNPGRKPGSKNVTTLVAKAIVLSGCHPFLLAAGQSAQLCARSTQPLRNGLVPAIGANPICSRVSGSLQTSKTKTLMPASSVLITANWMRVSIPWLAEHPTREGHTARKTCLRHDRQRQQIDRSCSRKRPLEAGWLIRVRHAPRLTARLTVCLERL